MGFIRLQLQAHLHPSPYIPAPPNPETRITLWGRNVRSGFTASELKSEGLKYKQNRALWPCYSIAIWESHGNRYYY